MILHRVAPSLLLLALAGNAAAASLPKITKVELQPLAAQARRVAEALELLGAPLADADRKALAAAGDDKDQARGVAAIQDILDRRCLARIELRKAKAPGHPTLHAEPGPARPELAEQGWRVFLVKVHNPDGLDNLQLRVDSPNALPLTRRSSGSAAPKV